MAGHATTRRGRSMACHASTSRTAPACQARQRRLVPTGIGSKYRDRLVLELVRADHPVQRIFNHAGETVGILGAGDENAIGCAQGGAQRQHGLRLAPFQVGVEQRQVRHVFKQQHAHAGRRQAGGGAQQRRVDRCGAQTARQTEYASDARLFDGTITTPTSRNPACASQKRH